MFRRVGLCSRLSCSSIPRGTLLHHRSVVPAALACPTTVPPRVHHPHRPTRFHMSTHALPPEPPVPSPLTLDELKSYLEQLSPSIRSSTSAWLVVLTSALVACRSGPDAVVHLYRLALSENEATKSSSQRLQSLIQETLVKGSVIFGIPPALDTVFVLLQHLRSTTPEYLLDKTHFAREPLLQEKISSLQTPAFEALDRVYRHNLDQILDEKMNDNMQDLKFLTLQINYGFTLANQTVIDWKLTELLVLAALVATNCRAEVLWHMRGALRAGWQRHDVESVASVTKCIARRLRVRTDHVPGLEDVKEDSND